MTKGWKKNIINIIKWRRHFESNKKNENSLIFGPKESKFKEQHQENFIY